MVDKPRTKSKSATDKPKPKSSTPSPSTTIKSTETGKNDNKPHDRAEHKKQQRIRYSERIGNANNGHNKNLPKEAKLTILDDCDDQKCDFDSLITDEVRRELTNENLKSLTGTDCDPQRFLKTLPPNKSAPFLEREIDARKLYQYLVSYMNVYYDLSIEGQVLSKNRQAMDDQLWDSVCYIIPLLCRQVINEALNKEPLVVTSHPDMLIFGDIHGNLSDIYYIQKNFLSNPKYEHYRLLFLGDYVDRGPKSVEVVIFLFTCKLIAPNRIILLRGNHEVQKVNKKYGFYAMIEYLFKDNYVKNLDITKLIYQSFNCAFNFLPVAAVIKQNGHKSIWCCHGGVPNSSLKNTNKDKPWTIEEMNALTKTTKPNALIPSKRSSKNVLALNEILWNDPIPRRVRSKLNKLFYINHRRGSHCSWFSETALISFCEANNLRLVIRGHQYKYTKSNGFELDGNLLTVFSSSCYCSTEENVTGYVTISSEMIVTPRILRTLEDSNKYRKFNFLEIKVDEKTKQITEVNL